MKKQLFFLSATLLVSAAAMAQVNIGANTVPNADAMLQVTSGTNKGFMLPSVALTATNAETPLTGPFSNLAGMTVYNTATAGTAPNNVTPGYYYSDGTQWVKIVATPSGNDKNIYDGDGTLAGNRTVTMGAKNLTWSSSTGNFIINSSSTGRVGINNTAPTSNLAIGGSVAVNYNSSSATSSITLGNGDYYYSWNGASATVLNLPSGTSAGCNCSGRIYRFRNTSATATAYLTITPASGETIDGNSTISVQPLQTLELVNTGAASGATWSVWNFSSIATQSATRFLGGTIIVPGDFTSNQTLISNANWVNRTYPDVVSCADNLNGGSSNGANVSITATSTAAGNISTPQNSVVKGNYYGKGYTVTNPSTGVFDITFTTPFTTIFGLSCNIYDVYQNSVSSGNNEAGYNNNINGAQLATTDNTQIGFISNSRVRVKTGDNGGNPRNRSFTFVVIGQ
ncbi:hypothetical protein ACTHGU_07510 [Chitinophagaceae bacterium MMS25-I14]